MRLCALALAFGATSALAADWVWLETPDVHQHYYDRSKVFIEGDTVSYWRRVVFRTPQQAKAGTARSAMYRERIDCRAHTHKTLGYLLYGADGAVIDNVYTPDGPPEPVIPETVGDHYEKLMCAMTAGNKPQPSAAGKVEPSLTSREALRLEMERLESRLREIREQLSAMEGASGSPAPAAPPGNQ